MKRLIALLAILVLLLAACGDSDPPKPADEGREKDRKCGAASKSLTKVVKRHARSAEVAKRQQKICRSSSRRATATVTLTGLADDSVAAERHRLRLVQRKGKWVVVRDRHEHKCQKGRGHQDFSKKLCV